MKFEQLLQIYWSKTFLYGGKARSFNISIFEFINTLEGWSSFNKFFFLKRFEFLRNSFFLNKNFTSFNLENRKIINMYLSQYVSINNPINQLLRYNIIRLYLIKSFRGKSQALGKPSRGQRTWSNASTSKKTNNLLKSFITSMRKENITKKKEEPKNRKMIKKKVKKGSNRVKVKVEKRKINIWY